MQNYESENSYIGDLSKIDADSFKDKQLYLEILSITDWMQQTAVANEIRKIAKQLDQLKMYDEMLRTARKMAQSAKVDEVESTGKAHSFITDFSFAEHQYNCGEWIATDNGVYRETDKGVQVACMHGIMISRILKNVDTEKFKVEIIFKVRNNVRKVIVDREILASTSKIMNLAQDSVQITSKYAPNLVSYLLDLEVLNPDKIKEYLSIGQLGWIDCNAPDGKIIKRFVPYDDDIVFDNTSGIKSLFDSIKASGDRNLWYDLIKKIRARRRNEININLAASFSSVLVEICGALPFIVSLWGGTGIGKTIILKICTSVWADPSEGKYITDPKATYTAMEIRQSVLNHLPMTLDDLAQVQRTYDGDYSDLIYRWCSGKGRDRSNVNLGLNKLTNWRNCTITNGERSIVDESTQGGAVNRVIDIESQGDPLFDAKSGNETVNVIEKNYGYAGREFIAVIQSMGSAAINKKMNYYIDQLKTTAENQGVEKEDKQIVPMAIILTADEIIEEHLFKDGIRLNIDDCLGYLKNKGEISEHERAYSYLVNEIIINKNKFTDIPDAEKETSEKWGFFREDYVTIYSAKLDDILKDRGFQPNAFLAWAKKLDLLKLSPKGEVRKNVSHGKHRGVRAVEIYMNYMADKNVDQHYEANSQRDKDTNDNSIIYNRSMSYIDWQSLTDAQLYDMFHNEILNVINGSTDFQEDTLPLYGMEIGDTTYFDPHESDFMDLTDEQLNNLSKSYIPDEDTETYDGNIISDVVMQQLFGYDM